jgi:Uma2 family endonuclease
VTLAVPPDKCYCAGMNVVLPTRMTVDEFLAWAMRQDKGRYELFDGRVVMQQPERWGHVARKGSIYVALLKAIELAKVSYFAATDGATVRIDTSAAFEPDALVAPLPFPGNDAIEVSNPVLVVEILSPSTAKRDLADKLAGYFKVPSIEHYLVLDPDEREIIWHRRAPGGTLHTPATLRKGTLRLNPPGIELALADVFPPEG